MILYGFSSVALSFSFHKRVFKGAVMSSPSFIWSVTVRYTPCFPSEALPSEKSSVSPAVKSSWINWLFTVSLPCLLSALSPSGSCWISSTFSCSASVSLPWSGVSVISDTSSVNSSSWSPILSTPESSSPFSSDNIVLAADTSVLPSEKTSSASPDVTSSSESEFSFVHAAVEAGTTLPLSSITNGSGSSAGTFSSSSSFSCWFIIAFWARIASIGEIIETALVCFFWDVCCAAVGTGIPVSPTTAARTPANIFFFIFIFHPPFFFSLSFFCSQKARDSQDHPLSGWLALSL